MKRTILHLAAFAVAALAVLSCSSGGTDGSSGGGMGCGQSGSTDQNPCNAHCASGYYQKAGDCVHCYRSPSSSGGSSSGSSGNSSSSGADSNQAPSH